MIPMNITEVAKKANVSVATVSRTINRRGTVNPKTAEKVWEVVRSVGYFPDTNARALVSGRSNLLGLVISDISNPFFPELVKGFEESALREGLDIIVTNTGYSLDRMEHSIRRMLERKVDGVAIMTSEMDEEFIRQLEKRHVPIVFLDTGRASDRNSNIRVDYKKGIDEAIDHLHQLRHKRIGYISGPLDLRSSIMRKSAFMKQLERYDLLSDPNLIQVGNHKIDGGETAMQRLLVLQNRPTAVLTSNDLTAIGALRTIWNAGLKVPQDVSVIGFDDIDFSQFTQPALTTIRLSRSKLGKAAFTALANVLEGAKGREYEFETELVVRSSTGRVPV
jgi:LacI family transcriptional regulator